MWEQEWEINENIKLSKKKEKNSVKERKQKKVKDGKKKKVRQTDTKPGGENSFSVLSVMSLLLLLGNGVPIQNPNTASLLLCKTTPASGAAGQHVVTFKRESFNYIPNLI